MLSEGSEDGSGSWLGERVGDRLGVRRAPCGPCPARRPVAARSCDHSGDCGATAGSQRSRPPYASFPPYDRRNADRKGCATVALNSMPMWTWITRRSPADNDHRLAGGNDGAVRVPRTANGFYLTHLRSISFARQGSGAARRPTSCRRWSAAIRTIIPLMATASNRGTKTAPVLEHAGPNWRRSR